MPHFQTSLGVLDCFYAMLNVFLKACMSAFYAVWKYFNTFHPLRKEQRVTKAEALDWTCKLRCTNSANCCKLCCWYSEKIIKSWNQMISNKLMSVEVQLLLRFLKISWTVQMAWKREGRNWTFNSFARLQIEGILIWVCHYKNIFLNICLEWLSFVTQGHLPELSTFSVLFL